MSCASLPCHLKKRMIFLGLWFNLGSASHWPQCVVRFSLHTLQGNVGKIGKEPLGLSVQLPFQECSSKSTHTPLFSHVPSDFQHFKLKHPLAIQKPYQKNPQETKPFFVSFLPLYKRRDFHLVIPKTTWIFTPLLLQWGTWNARGSLCLSSLAEKRG